MSSEIQTSSRNASTSTSGSLLGSIDLSTPRVLGAILVSVAVFSLAASLIGFPSGGPYDALMLHQPIGAAVVLLALVMLLPTVAVGTWLAGRVRYDAGWAAALTGLLLWRHRGGSVELTLDGASQGIFLLMALELLILAAGAAALWTLLHVSRERGATVPVLRRWLELPDSKVREIDRPRKGETNGERLLHLATSAGTCGLVVWLFCQNQDPVQTTVGVLLGGWLGALAAHAVIPVRPAYWSMAGPVVAGLLGYLAAFLTTPDLRLELGQAGGLLENLAYPLPLEWIGGAVPAALYGYVRSRTKQAEAVEAQQG